MALDLRERQFVSHDSKHPKHIDLVSCGLIVDEDKEAAGENLRACGVALSDLRLQVDDGFLLTAVNLSIIEGGAMQNV